MKVAPEPGRLLTVTSPSMSSASCLTIERPRPLPPKRRVIELSTCENGLNRRCCCSLEMPMPVSVTASTTRAMPPSTGSALARSMTPPRSVNFSALDSRLKMTWRTRVGSPTKASAGLEATMPTSDRPLRAAWGLNTSTAPSIRSLSTKGSSSSLSAPASMRE